MKMKILCTTLLFMLMVLSNPGKAQKCSDLNFQLQADIASTCGNMVMTMIHDNQGRPLLYVANKEAGLKIYTIAILTSPVLIGSVPISSLGGLHVMSLSQEGKFLLLALGNSFTNPQQGGMAIVDVTLPDAPVVSDYYIVPSSASGAGVVTSEGNYAYLGAMKSGLVILNISNKSDIQFVSQLMPNVNYPVSNPNLNLYNARGMVVKNSIVYLCFDAGGFRIINCANKTLPVETGRYANPALYTPINLPRAYNNLILDEPYVYIAVDYCGMEVLDISDTAGIKLKGWWNPYNCPGNNWFSSPVHANEIQFDKANKRVFISTGKSDLMVVDVSNPAAPDSCNFYGGVNNSIGTWGVGIYQNQLYLSYICTIGIPFTSNYTGVKILTFNNNATGLNEEFMNPISLYPNPVHNEITLEFNEGFKDAVLNIYNAIGSNLYTLTNCKSALKIDATEFPNGMYTLEVLNNKVKYYKKYIVLK